MIPILFENDDILAVNKPESLASIPEFGAYTLVRAYPLTGRRHQIRVHFYSIGHPIVGDLRYGDKAVQRTFARLMLHRSTDYVPAPIGRGSDHRSANPGIIQGGYRDGRGRSCTCPGHPRGVPLQPK
jgi:23S rRNA-/tRNA-specific pseudouridylate synthase